jgi:hypothetical protein
MLVNDSSGHKVISFLDGNVGYNQIFMVEEDMHKTAFRCPGLVFLMVMSGIIKFSWSRKTCTKWPLDVLVL